MPNEDDVGSCIDIEITCDSYRQIFNEDKTGCIVCDSYERANDDSSACLSDTCWYEDQILTVEGTCTKCPLGNVADETGKICIPFISKSICRGDR
jgi:hypothetical protein